MCVFFYQLNEWIAVLFSLLLCNSYHHKFFHFKYGFKNEINTLRYNMEYTKPQLEKHPSRFNSTFCMPVLSIEPRQGWLFITTQPTCVTLYSLYHRNVLKQRKYHAQKGRPITTSWTLQLIGQPIFLYALRSFVYLSKKFFLLHNNQQIDLRL